MFLNIQLFALRVLFFSRKTLKSQYNISKAYLDTKIVSDKPFSVELELVDGSIIVYALEDSKSFSEWFQYFSDLSFDDDDNNDDNHDKDHDDDKSYSDDEVRSHSDDDRSHSDDDRSHSDSYDSRDDDDRSYYSELNEDPKGQSKVLSKSIEKTAEKTVEKKKTSKISSIFGFGKKKDKDKLVPSTKDVVVPPTRATQPAPPTKTADKPPVVASVADKKPAPPVTKKNDLPATTPSNMKDSQLNDEHDKYDDDYDSEYDSEYDHSEYDNENDDNDGRKVSFSNNKNTEYETDISGTNPATKRNTKSPTRRLSAIFGFNKNKKEESKPQPPQPTTPKQSDKESNDSTPKISGAYGMFARNLSSNNPLSLNRSNSTSPKPAERKNPPPPTSARPESVKIVSPMIPPPPTSTRPLSMVIPPATPPPPTSNVNKPMNMNASFLGDIANRPVKLKHVELSNKSNIVPIGKVIDLEPSQQSQQQESQSQLPVPVIPSPPPRPKSMRRSLIISESPKIDSPSNSTSISTSKPENNNTNRRLSRRYSKAVPVDPAKTVESITSTNLASTIDSTDLKEPNTEKSIEIENLEDTPGKTPMVQELKKVLKTPHRRSLILEPPMIDEMIKTRRESIKLFQFHSEVSDNNNNESIDNNNNNNNNNNEIINDDIVTTQEDEAMNQMFNSLQTSLQSLTNNDDDDEIVLVPRSSSRRTPSKSNLSLPDDDLAQPIEDISFINNNEIINNLNDNENEIDLLIKEIEIIEPKVDTENESKIETKVELKNESKIETKVELTNESKIETKVESKNESKVELFESIKEPQLQSTQNTIPFQLNESIINETPIVSHPKTERPKSTKITDKIEQFSGKNNNNNDKKAVVVVDRVVSGKITDKIDMFTAKQNNNNNTNNETTNRSNDNNVGSINIPKIYNTPKVNTNATNPITNTNANTNPKFTSNLNTNINSNVNTNTNTNLNVNSNISPKAKQIKNNEEHIKINVLNVSHPSMNLTRRIKIWNYSNGFILNNINDIKSFLLELKNNSNDSILIKLAEQLQSILSTSTSTSIFNANTNTNTNVNANINTNELFTNWILLINYLIIQEKKMIIKNQNNINTIQITIEIIFLIGTEEMQKINFKINSNDSANQIAEKVSIIYTIIFTEYQLN